MKAKQKLIDNFYLKTFFIGWGLCCAVWSFMIFQFWWGNHDWGYLKDGVFINTGFFEMRYTQHLPTVLFFDGHILPVMTFVCAVTMLMILTVLAANYLEIPKSMKNYLFVMLFVGLNPYNFVLFYYVYLCFVYVFWGLVDVLLLFLLEKQRKWHHFLFGAFLLFLIFGSYPPNIAMLLVLFLAKRLKKYCDGKENFVQVCQSGIYFCFQLFLGYCGFKFAFWYLESMQFINKGMYNISFRSMGDIFYQVMPELMKSLLQLFHQHTFLENVYCLLTAVFVIFAVILVYQSEVSKFGVTLLLLALFLASRFAFLIVGDSSKIAECRLEYWGRLGIMLFAMSVVLRSKSFFVKNFSSLWFFIVFFLFVDIDFEIQKVQYLGFQAARQMQQRMHEYVSRQPMFDLKKQYLSISLGNPNFRIKYVDDKYFTEEMTGNALTFSVEYILSLFWGDTLPFITVRSSLGENVIYKISVSAMDYWKNNPQNMENIRYWLYNRARYGSVYVDDRYIIAILDMKDFYKYREIVATQLDK